MKIACCSDMHSNLDFAIKESDILLIAGDILPAYRDSYLSINIQNNFLKDKFYPWIEDQPVNDVVFIAGNHDWIFDSSFDIPPMPSKLHYLCDNEITISGLRIYGTPQQPIFLNWAFNKTEEQLQRYFDNIPLGLDILLSHTSPYKIMDKVNLKNRKGHFGCMSLKNRIDKIKPRYVVFGHFHDNYGKIEQDGITYINCSLLNESYKMTKEPIYIEV